jgi:hypothetical protein
MAEGESFETLETLYVTIFTNVAVRASYLANLTLIEI